MVSKNKKVAGYCLCILTVIAIAGILYYLINCKSNNIPHQDPFQSPEPNAMSAQLAGINTDSTKPATPTGACDVSQIKFYDYYINESN